jgi:hypothetical protein
MRAAATAAAAAAGLLASRMGLFQAGGGGDEKEEVEVAGDANARLEARDDAVDVEMGEAVTADRARRVSRARPSEGGLAGTTVAADADDVEDTDPRESGAEQDNGDEDDDNDNDDLGTCLNSPTKPGLPLGANSKVG